MAEKDKQHSLVYDNNTLTIRGIKQVVEISEKEGQFKLSDNTLVVRGSGLNVTKLDKEQGVVTLEVNSLTSLTYRQSGMNLKGLFR